MAREENTQQPQQPQIECPQAIHVRKTRHSSVSMRTNFTVILVGETNYKQNFGGAGTVIHPTQYIEILSPEVRVS